jgi:hypothetical protein
MKQYNFFIFKIFNFCIAATLLCVACVSCDNIVDYNDNYSPADQIANNGAPVIKAVYDVADTAFSSPITEGTLNQTVVLVGENLNSVQSVSFNTVACDMKNVYTMSTKAIVQIPSKLSMEQVNKIAYTTVQGSTTYDFLIPFPDLTISSLACEFTNAGDSVTVYGKNFDLYDFEGGSSTVHLDGQQLGVGSVTADAMKVLIPEGTSENSELVFNWQTNGTAYAKSLPFRPSAYLLYGDFSGVSMNVDGSVKMAIEGDEGIGASAWLNQKNLHFTGSYSAWAWNTIDISCNMVDVTVDDVNDFVLKFEVLTPTNFPLTEQTGLQFCFNWGDSYAWNPANGLGINTFGQWQTVSIPLAPMATKGISEPGKWQTLRIIFQPHAAYDADFRLANFRIVKK